MNLIEKYIEVVKGLHGFKYKVQVIDHINETLGTDYRNTALNNWASETSPRAVPAPVVALMRETVIPHLLKELNVDVKVKTTERFVTTINNESAMREQLVEDFITEQAGVKISAAKLKALTQVLEPPGVRD